MEAFFILARDSELVLLSKDVLMKSLSLCISMAIAAILPLLISFYLVKICECNPMICAEVQFFVEKSQLGSALEVFSEVKLND